MSLGLSVEIKSDTKGLKVLGNLLRRIDNSVEIGFFDGKTHPKNDGANTIAEVGMINELGIGVPSRPFMRETLIENNNYIAQLGSKMGAVVTGKVKTKQALKELGAKIQTDIQEKIADNNFKENAPATIAKKGMDDPLTETGTLERDVSHRVN
jgi:hypothetical protein